MPIENIIKKQAQWRVARGEAEISDTFIKDGWVWWVLECTDGFQRLCKAHRTLTEN